MPELLASMTQTLPKADQNEEIQRLSVLLPLPLGGCFDYLAPPGETFCPGEIVVAPLAGRDVYGVVWDSGRLTANPVEQPLPPEKLREVRERVAAPPFSEPARRFVEWIAAYYVVQPGSVLRAALGGSAALRPAPKRKLYRLREDPASAGDLRMTAARRRVVETLAEGPARPLGDLAASAGVSASVIKGLEEAGLIEAVEAEQRLHFAAPDWTKSGPTLSPEQREAAQELRDKVGTGTASVTLLDGVTGSGKTEVYFEAIAEALAKGLQALVLLPEIALSAQWLQRFAERFGALPGVWHSDLGQRERRGTWQAVAASRVQVVVGARSALFLPFQNLGLIVIDEEHDASYKQDDGLPYHARDMAVVRGSLEKIPVVLASATPSLETLTNVDWGRYGCLELSRRHGSSSLPSIEVVDLRKDVPLRHPGVPGSAGQSWLSTALRGAVSAALAEGEQAMLFLNRRGYAPLTLCRRCGHRIECPLCSAWLVEHRLIRRLQCHHCGHFIGLPDRCPNCDTEDSLAACGPGVERVAEEGKRLWPEARQAIMSSDTLGGPKAAADLVACVQAREVDLLIGTQIAAKGYHFPHLTLVGVIDADLGLYGGDLRASERTFQLLQQVAGRAGRAERPGRVLIQTAEPDHPVMRALKDGDRTGFLAAEIEGRKRGGLPPFGRLAAVILSAPDQALVDRVAGELARNAPREKGWEVLGPAPAPLAVLRGRHRRRFLVRTRRDVSIQAGLRKWLSGLKLPGQIRLRVDVDPQSFL
jgi:primosomal protein N' (replication factor Y)